MSREKLGLIVALLLDELPDSEAKPIYDKLIDSLATADAEELLWKIAEVASNPNDWDASLN